MSIRINGDNTAANPGITGTDTDTGLQFGTDEVNIVTGGTTRATVDSNGDFSVNTDAIFVDASADSVGIGTNSPGAKLDVKGNASSNNILLLTNGNTGSYANKIQGRSADGTLNAAIYLSSGDDSIGFEQGTSSTLRMLLDSAGRLLLGTTTEGHPNADDLTIAGSGHTGITIRSGSTSVGGIFFSDATTGSGEYDGAIEYNQNTRKLTFYTATTNRMEIEANGRTGIFTTDTDSFDVGNSNGTGTTRKTIRAYHSASGIANGTEMFYVQNNGDVKNTNNSYGSISDQRLKENIVDAGSQWQDIKDLRVRKFNFREDTGHQTHTQIGLIAQEAETVSAGLVADIPVTSGEVVLDADGIQLESTKTVNYSVLYMKSVKALQEAMTRIEALETRVAQLEGGTN